MRNALRALTIAFSALPLALVFSGCGHSASGVLSGGSPAGIMAPLVGGSTQTPLLPDPHLTPGATLPVTVQDISVAGYAHKVRNVPQAVKDQVYAEYGITSHPPGAYEVDHLISLELGGSNSIKNLWPQSYQTQPWNAHVKDKLENRLHDLVCSGQVPLAVAQHDIATNWIAAYKHYFGVDAPLMRGASRSHGASWSQRTPSLSGNGTAYGNGSENDNPSGQVWVNTHSGKYFFPGSRYYGHTREGQYMTEQAAQQQGYVAARGE